MFRLSGSILILILRILVIVALLVALYFGVRWVYEQFRDSNNTTSQTAPSDNSGTTSENGNNVVVDESATANTTTSSDNPTNHPVSQTSQPSNATPQSIPNTGSESIMVIFISTVVLGALVHHFVFVRK